MPRLSININLESLKFIKVFDNSDTKKPFKYGALFIKNNQSMTRHDFKSTYDSLCEYLTEKQVNFGILMFADGTYIFTEKRIDYNPILIKLATGINLIGQKQFNLTKWLEKFDTTGSTTFDYLLREPNDKI